MKQVTDLAQSLTGGDYYQAEYIHILTMLCVSPTNYNECIMNAAMKATHS